MRKLIQLTEKTHFELKLFCAANRIQTFDEGIKKLLSSDKK